MQWVKSMWRIKTSFFFFWTLMLPTMQFHHIGNICSRGVCAASFLILLPRNVTQVQKRDGRENVFAKRKVQGYLPYAARAYE